MVPTVALPPVTPLTCQVTAVLLVFCTVAVSCWVFPTDTVFEAVEMVTVTVCVVVSIIADGVPQPTVGTTLTATAASNTQLTSRLAALTSLSRLRRILMENPSED